MVDSQFLRALPSHHMCPSLPIRPHTASHCPFIILFSLYACMATRECVSGPLARPESRTQKTYRICHHEYDLASTRSSRSRILRIPICSTVDMLLVRISICVTSNAAVKTPKKPALVYAIDVSAVFITRSNCSAKYTHNAAITTSCGSTSKFGRIVDARAFSPTRVEKTHEQNMSAQKTKIKKNWRRHWSTKEHTR